MVVEQKKKPTWRIGPAGWSYADWRGRVYPDPIPRQFDALRWMARFFGTIEINASFYRIPPVAHADSWVRRIAHRDDFRFAVKLHRSFTHDDREIDPEALKITDSNKFWPTPLHGVWREP